MTSQAPWKPELKLSDVYVTYLRGAGCNRTSHHLCESLRISFNVLLQYMYCCEIYTATGTATAYRGGSCFEINIACDCQHTNTLRILILVTKNFNNVMKSHGCYRKCYKRQQQGRSRHNYLLIAVLLNETQVYWFLFSINKYVPKNVSCEFRKLDTIIQLYLVNMDHKYVYIEKLQSQF